MAVRSRRLFGPVAQVAGATTLYTVPAGRTAVVRQLVAVNKTAAPVGGIYLMVNGISGSTHALDYNITISTNSRRVWSDWMALNPGDVLYGYQASAGTLLWWAFGALLLGEPD